MESDSSEAVTKGDQFFIATASKVKGSPSEPQGQLREGMVGKGHCSCVVEHDPQLSLKW